MANNINSPIGIGYIPNLTTYATLDTQHNLNMLDFNFLGRQKGILELKKVNAPIDSFAVKALENVKNRLKENYNAPGDWDTPEEEEGGSGADQAQQQG